MAVVPSVQEPTTPKPSVQPDPDDGRLSRRDMLKATGQLSAGAAIASFALPARAYAAENNTIQLALVGCGGRGNGAAENALSRQVGPTKLVAMADVQPANLSRGYAGLKGRFPDQVDVSEDAKFIGMNAYKQAMDRLNPGDVVLLTTPPAFRWPMFQYAIEKGLNVFMEKPVTVDGPTSRRMLELSKKADEKNLKIAVGLMCRHCDARRELFDRIQDGQLGDIVLMRGYRVQPPIADCFVERMPAGEDELLWQIRYFHAFLWPGGGSFSDFFIHNIDECSWMKNSFPVEAKGYGGRHYRMDYVDQNFDSYTVEYTFADGAKLMFEGRNMAGCDNEFASYVHGTKGSAVISENGHWPSKARIFKNQKMTRDNVVWAYGEEKYNPYEAEWDHLFQAIREDQVYNELPRGVEASLVTSMGRMAAHTGQVITYDDILNSTHEFAPDVDKLTFDAPAPLQMKDGKYPWPEPGIKRDREF